MSVSFPTRITPLTIANGQQFSNELVAREDYHSGYLMVLYAALSLGADAGFTFTIQVAPEMDRSVAGTWRDLIDSTGSVVTAPGEAKAKAYAELFAAGKIRIKSSSVVTAARTWEVVMSETVTAY